MKRKVYGSLLSWKSKEENKKTLTVIGARQFGKTFIVNEFCKNEIIYDLLPSQLPNESCMFQFSKLVRGVS